MILPAMMLAAAVMLISGCVRRPGGVLSDDDMAPVLADMQLAEAYMRQNGSDDNMREALLLGVLDKYGISREEYDSTMNWYARNADDYAKLDEQVAKELVKRRREIGRMGGAAGGGEEEADDMWPYKRMAVFSELSGSDILPFSLPVNDVKPGMTVTWKMKCRSTSDMNMLLGVEYDDGAVASLVRPMHGTRRMEVTLQTDTARKVTRVFGHLAAERRGQLPIWVDSISLSAQPLDSTQYYKIYSQRLLMRPSRRRPASLRLNDSIAADNQKMQVSSSMPAMVRQPRTFHDKTR